MGITKISIIIEIQLYVLLQAFLVSHFPKWEGNSCAKQLYLNPSYSSRIQVLISAKFIISCLDLQQNSCQANCEGTESVNVQLKRARKSFLIKASSHCQNEHTLTSGILHARSFCRTPWTHVHEQLFICSKEFPFSRQRCQDRESIFKCILSHMNG